MKLGCWFATLAVIVGFSNRVGSSRVPTAGSAVSGRCFGGRRDRRDVAAEAETEPISLMVRRRTGPRRAAVEPPAAAVVDGGGRRRLSTAPAPDLVAPLGRL